MDGSGIISTAPVIRILEAESNKKGDLFARLIQDLFLSFGYDRLVRLNVQKAGREVDIEIEHRTEPKRVIAECKATQKRTGGDEINKFVGVLDVEKRKNSDTQIIGYFISLSGFKQTAIEQEKDAGGNRVIFLNGKQVLEELINGRIIVSKDYVMELAGRCSIGQTVNLKVDTKCEILAHDIGWIWLVYFTQNKQRTHFALIHADGEALAPALAENIIQSDMSVGGHLHSLEYLPPPIEASTSEGQIRQAKTEYFDYIAAECGEMTLEGLPADQEVGSRRLKLENIFVPMHLEEISNNDVDSLSTDEERQKSDKKERESVGEVISKYQRLAILATPGGGKTTLIKRLAVAYAYPDRSKLVDDHLPDRPWMPLFIRCRQLGDMVKSPIRDILYEIPKRAEIDENLRGAFVHIVNDSLRSGDALLLIDGLDEISDEGNRVSFVNQLRTFLAIYPNVNIVVTSREAGFRVVGGAMSAHCKHYKVADFEDEDIKRLTLAWHKEVVGDRAEVQLEAEALAKTIIDSNRVRELAKNPLLLTTLLLVKRWVGQLPTRRSVLYGKAIEVLLMTWNVEGYEPIDQDEAIPQLAFIAFTMMKEGVQTISLKRLKDILYLARREMPEVLGYSRLSVTEFIERIEFRSSLLMLSGHDIEEGTLYPMYEFRHLTFQEYLTARAVVDGYYPDRKEDDTPLSILKPYLANEQWKEVVPLVAVLVGRKIQPLIQHLIDLCGKSLVNKQSEKFCVTILEQSLLDEIQISPDLLEEGLKCIARHSFHAQGHIIPLYNSKFGEKLLEIIQDTYTTTNKDLSDLGLALGYITLEQINWKSKEGFSSEIAEKLSTILDDENQIQRAAGALATTFIAYEGPYEEIKMKHLNALGDKIIPILYSDKQYLQFAACWAFAWLGEKNAWTPAHKPDVISCLFEIWRRSQVEDIQYVASWAITALPLIDRELKPIPEPNQTEIDFIRQQFELRGLSPSMKNWPNSFASLLMAFYWKTPWNDEEIAKLITYNIYIEHVNKQNIDAFLHALGEPGKVQLKALKQEISIKRS